MDKFYVCIAIDTNSPTENANVRGRVFMNKENALADAKRRANRDNEPRYVVEVIGGFEPPSNVQEMTFS